MSFVLIELPSPFLRASRELPEPGADPRDRGVPFAATDPGRGRTSVQSRGPRDGEGPGWRRPVASPVGGR